ncbi:hypothetical protein JX265_002532 [Neoarthrinium moseri]|uniref:Uncharacterized protein n=1 Tax=Neoarthrinium moseri TaxID=1658444 RepID=A0A9P9WV09_9PEZI|nr:uncharacterized protein JN550_000346 [Neoarthrinium moseri]KAI1878164.1 hypothetical protein JN550_000346 [Neoarthrinium moseri]KAI1879578.1 hypothetical protein JX265_002532 [Neoarthrinium moseri]
MAARELFPGIYIISVPICDGPVFEEFFSAFAEKFLKPTTPSSYRVSPIDTQFGDSTGSTISYNTNHQYYQYGFPASHYKPSHSPREGGTGTTSPCERNADVFTCLSRPDPPVPAPKPPYPNPPFKGREAAYQAGVNSGLDGDRMQQSTILQDEPLPDHSFIPFLPGPARPHTPDLPPSAPVPKQHQAGDKVGESSRKGIANNKPVAQLEVHAFCACCASKALDLD